MIASFSLITIKIRVFLAQCIYLYARNKREKIKRKIKT